MQLVFCLNFAWRWRLVSCNTFRMLCAEPVIWKYYRVWLGKCAPNLGTLMVVQNHITYRSRGRWLAKCVTMQSAFPISCRSTEPIQLKPSFSTTPTILIKYITTIILLGVKPGLARLTKEAVDSNISSWPTTPSTSLDVNLSSLSSWILAGTIKLPTCLTWVFSIFNEQYIMNFSWPHRY